VRGVRMQLHWHENPLYRFAARADLAANSTIQRNVGRLADYGWTFDLQVFARQMADAAGLAESCPKVTFVLQHAGMLEDLSREGRSEWRAGMVRLAACPNVVARLSGLGTFLHRNDAAHIAEIVRETAAIFGAERCMFGSNFPVEKLWTSYGALVEAYRDALRPLSERDQRAILHDTAMRIYRIQT
jgi:predicted TIM-barrel fold metal-dependent hydrolase